MEKLAFKSGKCCVPGCRDRFNKRHRFPNPKSNLKFFKKWVQNISVPLFKDLPIKYIYKCYYVCHRHFMNEYLVPGTKRGLRWDAVPTLFLSVSNEDLPLQAEGLLASIMPSTSEVVQVSTAQKCSLTNSEQVDSMKWTYTLDEQLITLVQQHECLYDIINPNYGSIQMKEESWFEIGRKLECKGEDCKERWGLLRSYYRKALQRKKAITKKSKMWKFEPQMEFLQQHMQEQKTTSTVQEITKMDEFQDEFDSNEGEDEMYIKREAEEIHIKEEEIHIKEEDVFEMQSSPVGSPFVLSPIGNGLHEHEQSSTSEMATSVQKCLPPSQFHQESEETAKSQRDVQKKKLMIFFDYVAESMLKFSELEQVQIKKDIFNIINQKELQLLNVK